MAEENKHDPLESNAKLSRTIFKGTGLMKRKNSNDNLQPEEEAMDHQDGIAEETASFASETAKELESARKMATKQPVEVNEQQIQAPVKGTKSRRKKTRTNAAIVNEDHLQNGIAENTTSATSLVKEKKTRKRKPKNAEQQNEQQQEGGIVGDTSVTAALKTSKRSGKKAIKKSVEINDGQLPCCSTSSDPPCSSQGGGQQPEVQDHCGEPEMYLIQYIKGVGIDRETGEYLYKVKWERHKEETWEPVESFCTEGSKHTLEVYLKENTETIKLVDTQKQKRYLGCREMKPGYVNVKQMMDHVTERVSNGWKKRKYVTKFYVLWTDNTETWATIGDLCGAKNGYISLKAYRNRYLKKKETEGDGQMGEPGTKQYFSRLLYRVKRGVRKNQLKSRSTPDRPSTSSDEQTAHTPSAAAKPHPSPNEVHSTSDSQTSQETSVEKTPSTNSVHPLEEVPPLPPTVLPILHSRRERAVRERERFDPTPVPCYKRKVRKEKPDSPIPSASSANEQTSRKIASFSMEPPPFPAEVQPPRLPQPAQKSSLTTPSTISIRKPAQKTQGRTGHKNVKPPSERSTSMNSPPSLGDMSPHPMEDAESSRSPSRTKVSPEIRFSDPPQLPVEDEPLSSSPTPSSHHQTSSSTTSSTISNGKPARKKHVRFDPESLKISTATHLSVNPPPSRGLADYADHPPCSSPSHFQEKNESQEPPTTMSSESSSVRLPVLPLPLEGHEIPSISSASKEILSDEMHTVNAQGNDQLQGDPTSGKSSSDDTTKTSSSSTIFTPVSAEFLKTVSANISSQMSSVTPPQKDQVGGERKSKKPALPPLPHVHWIAQMQPPYYFHQQPVRRPELVPATLTKQCSVIVQRSFPRNQQPSCSSSISLSKTESRAKAKKFGRPRKQPCKSTSKTATLEQSDVQALPQPSPALSDQPTTSKDAALEAPCSPSTSQAVLRPSSRSSTPISGLSTIAEQAHFLESSRSPTKETLPQQSPSVPNQPTPSKEASTQGSQEASCSSSTPEAVLPLSSRSTTPLAVLSKTKDQGDVNESRQASRSPNKKRTRKRQSDKGVSSAISASSSSKMKKPLMFEGFIETAPGVRESFEELRRRFYDAVRHRAEEFKEEVIKVEVKYHGREGVLDPSFYIDQMTMTMTTYCLSWRYPPLHIAALLEHVEFIQLLLEIGCPIESALDYSQDTALEVAYKNKKSKAMIALMRSGFSTERLFRHSMRESARCSLKMLPISPIDKLVTDNYFEFGEYLDRHFRTEEMKVVARYTRSLNDEFTFKFNFDVQSKDDLDDSVFYINIIGFGDREKTYLSSVDVNSAPTERTEKGLKVLRLLEKNDVEVTFADTKRNGRWFVLQISSTMPV